MSLFTRAQETQEHLNAVLADSEKVRERVEISAQKVAARAAADKEKIEATRQQIRRRSEQRQERVRHRPRTDPTLAAAIEALKLLERRQ